MRRHPGAGAGSWHRPGFISGPVRIPTATAATPEPPNHPCSLDARRVRRVVRPRSSVYGITATQMATIRVCTR